MSDGLKLLQLCPLPDHTSCYQWLTTEVEVVVIGGASLAFSFGNLPASSCCCSLISSSVKVFACLIADHALNRISSAVSGPYFGKGLQ